MVRVSITRDHTLRHRNVSHPSCHFLPSRQPHRQQLPQNSPITLPFNFAMLSVHKFPVSIQPSVDKPVARASFVVVAWKVRKPSSSSSSSITTMIQWFEAGKFQAEIMANSRLGPALSDKGDKPTEVKRRRRSEKVEKKRIDENRTEAVSTRNVKQKEKGGDGFRKENSRSKSWR